MKIAFCTPFKPIDHARVSGDVTIAGDLVRTLSDLGHETTVLPHVSAKEIYLEPGRWFGAWRGMRAMAEAAARCDCWLTYGSYYKVPDVFGPSAARRLGLPYFIFQASFAENRARTVRTWPGFMLNRRAMRAADHIFCNRVNDLRGCAKLLSEERYTYVKPGLPDGLFKRDETARARLRAEWGVGETPVVNATAMMRAGVKMEGLRWVVDACAELLNDGVELYLALAGDGPGRDEIESLARQRLGDRVRCLGLVDRAELAGVFSACDVFAFPGLEESVGMVYLEAQRCGLPVVATEDEGAPHVAVDGRTGFVTSVSRGDFTGALHRLLTNPDLRRDMGQAAVEYVQSEHDSAANYAVMADVMARIVRRRRDG